MIISLIVAGIGTFACLIGLLYHSTIYDKELKMISIVKLILLMVASAFPIYAAIYLLKLQREIAFKKKLATYSLIIALFLSTCLFLNTWTVILVLIVVALICFIIQSVHYTIVQRWL